LERHKDKTEIDFYVYIIDIPSIQILSKSLSGVEKNPWERTERGCVMTEPEKVVETEKVACEICLKHVPKSETKVEEASDYVLYFCGIDCYEKWREEEKE